MQFSDTSNRTGIIQGFERKTDLGVGVVSGNTNLLKDVTVYCNNTMHDLWFDIFAATGKWQYEDDNQSDLPAGTVDLVSGTSKYALPAEALRVRRIDYKSSDGNWSELTQITDTMIEGGLEEFMETAGTPRYYRLVGGTYEIFPASDYNSTAGLKVFFDREAVEFSHADTTKKPGFASPFHELVPLGASIQWLDVKQSNSGTLPRLIQRYEMLRQKMIKYYQRRNNLAKPRISRQYENFS
jgi:hypothetical protein